MFNLTRPLGLLRLLSALALLAVLVTSTGGGCTVVWNDDDDDDCYDDDDDWDDGWDDDDDDDDCYRYTSSNAEYGEPRGFTLDDYVLETSEEAGTHPVRRLTGIQELNLFRELGPGLHGPESLQAFTLAVLEENVDLFTLPAGAGHLRFFSAQDSGGSMVVTWVQEADGREAEDFEPGAGVFFLLDSLGNLVEIHNLTTIPESVDGLRPVAVPRSLESPPR